MAHLRSWRPLAVLCFCVATIRLIAVGAQRGRHFKETLEARRAVRRVQGFPDGSSGGIINSREPDVDDPTLPFESPEDALNAPPSTDPADELLFPPTPPPIAAIDGSAQGRRSIPSLHESAALSNLSQPVAADAAQGCTERTIDDTLDKETLEAFERWLEIHGMAKASLIAASCQERQKLDLVLGNEAMRAINKEREQCVPDPLDPIAPQSLIAGHWRVGEAKAPSDRLLLLEEPPSFFTFIHFTNRTGLWKWQIQRPFPPPCEETATDPQSGRQVPVDSRLVVSSRMAAEAALNRERTSRLCHDSKEIEIVEVLRSSVQIVQGFDVSMVVAVRDRVNVSSAPGSPSNETTATTTTTTTLNLHRIVVEWTFVEGLPRQADHRVPRLPADAQACPRRSRRSRILQKVLLGAWFV
ncbi:unnamed protein product [Vitrella brassicaformis CCMP3155]|uniref:Uncharacterized protein n=1 Tax=Vitrella brassicaformis (strain CCMP3155) TaxID=1169540 RepID=A0A0G4ETH6_VITBC|nr:unnamed protein product [Vitrella brassicaformis CCMP3155]|eukprot:CEM01909.1 unnamed protein product [Vitrella brassicaformis CCMP3155]